jgi:signal peptidase II
MKGKLLGRIVFVLFPGRIERYNIYMQIDATVVTDTATHTRTLRRSFVLWAFVFFFAVALDQYTKWVVFGSRDATHFLSLAVMHFQNHALLFGISLPAYLVVPMYSALLVVLLYYLWSSFSDMQLWQRAGWVLVLAGGVSNFLERLVLGYVRDFVVIASGIFNLADAFIIIGVVLVLLAEYRKSA